jgi:hypothetical protein
MSLIDLDSKSAASWDELTNAEEGDESQKKPWTKRVLHSITGEPDPPDVTETITRRCENKVFACRTIQLLNSVSGNNSQWLPKACCLSKF